MYKARSITNKASSACKMNMALIEGEREVDKVMTKKVGFNEAAEGAMGAIGGSKKQAPAADKGDSDSGGQSDGAIDVTEDKAPAPTPMRRSPAKLDPMTIMKVAGMASSVMGSKKKGGDGGGKQETKVVVNNASAAPAPTSSGGNSQASNAIDPK